MKTNSILWYFQIISFSPGQIVNGQINLPFFLVIMFLHNIKSNFLLYYSTKHFTIT